MVQADTGIQSAIMPFLVGHQVTNVFLAQTHLIVAQGTGESPLLRQEPGRGSRTIEERSKVIY